MPVTLTPFTDPSAFEWWSQIIIPGVGSLAAVAAAVVSVVALLFSRSARSAVVNIREGLNRDAGAIDAAATVSATGSIGAEGVVGHSWEMTDSDGLVEFRNTSGQAVTLVGVESTSNHPLTLGFDLPQSVPDGASFRVRYHRTLGGSAVIGITLVWTISDGRELTKTYYV